MSTQVREGPCPTTYRQAYRPVLKWNLCNKDGFHYFFFFSYRELCFVFIFISLLWFFFCLKNHSFVERRIELIQTDVEISKSRKKIIFLSFWIKVYTKQIILSVIPLNCLETNCTWHKNLQTRLEYIILHFIPPEIKKKKLKNPYIGKIILF